MSLQPPEKVEKLQTALHAKAKASPDYRFYALYDKLYRWDVLVHAYQRCKANKGAAGVDDQTFQDIESYGERRWLEELAKEIQDKTYTTGEAGVDPEAGRQTATVGDPNDP